jgi:protein-S-isoprenylcysteine O-methyltransferase Ste14
VPSTAAKNGAEAVANLARRRTSVRVDRPPTTLVTDGPFRYSRNPIYVAMVALLIGVGLFAGILWHVLLAPAAAVLLRKAAIEPEERHLETRFGEAWRAYAGRTRRWI